MTQRMEFFLLGPLLVRCDGAAVPVQRGKQRALLAVLLLNAGRTVSADDLAEALWGSSPPPSAPVTLRNYVKRLRSSLGEAGRSRIGTQPPGYLIRVEAGELDVDRFEEMLGAARDSARGGMWDKAADQARAALSLWRGQPLADTGSEVLALREAGRLAEMRLQALETRTDADLHLGRHAEVIGELEQLTATHPLRERQRAQLMLALYRDGRQAEALAAYRQARQVLIDELGAEPGTALQELHQQILTADPALALPALPSAPSSFTGTRTGTLGTTGTLGATDTVRASHATSAPPRPTLPGLPSPGPGQPGPGLPGGGGRGTGQDWVRRLAGPVALAAAGVLLGAALAGSSHPAGVVGDGSDAVQTSCDTSAITLGSQPVRTPAGVVLGQVEVRYSLKCAAGWARFDPAFSLSQLRSPLITVQVTRRADGASYRSRFHTTTHSVRSKILLVDETCLQATVIITGPAQPPLTASTPCQAAP